MARPRHGKLYASDLCKCGDRKGGVAHFDGQRYELGSFVIMPNHVHALVRPLACNLYPLEKILQSWKQFTAKRILRQSGIGVSLWQEESFDRIVRDEEHLYHCVQYIGSNPARAKLAKGAVPAMDSAGVGRTWLEVRFHVGRIS